MRDSIGYGLMLKRKVAKAERYRKVGDAGAGGLPGVGNLKPGQLSRASAKRIAIARALINQPRIPLLDEPLGALDLKLREQMQLFTGISRQRQRLASPSSSSPTTSRRRSPRATGSASSIRARSGRSPRRIPSMTPPPPFVARFVGTRQPCSMGAGPPAVRRCSVDDGAALSGSASPRPAHPGWSGRCARLNILGLRALSGRSRRAALSLSSTTPTPGPLPRGARVSLSWPGRRIHRLHTAPQGAQTMSAPHSASLAMSQPTAPLSLSRAGTSPPCSWRPACCWLFCSGRHCCGLASSMSGSLLMLLSTPSSGWTSSAARSKPRTGAANSLPPAG